MIPSKIEANKAVVPTAREREVDNKDKIIGAVITETTHPETR